MTRAGAVISLFLCVHEQKRESSTNCFWWLQDFYGYMERDGFKFQRPRHSRVLIDIFTSVSRQVDAREGLPRGDLVARRPLLAGCRAAVNSRSASRR